MNSDEKERQGFINAITKEVVKMIAKDEKISISDAEKEFKDSKTYRFLAYSDDPFVEEDPYDFFDWFKNEKKYGRIVSSTDLYLERHPELYSRI